MFLLIYLLGFLTTVFGSAIREHSWFNGALNRPTPYPPPRNPGGVQPWERRVVNSDKGRNNCPYATVAGCQGTTIQKVISRTGGSAMYMDSQHIQTPKDIQRLAQQSGYPAATYRQFGNLDKLQNYLNTQVRRGQAKTYGFAYTHPNGNGGHVVAHRVWKDRQPGSQVVGRTIDFQQSRYQRVSNPTQVNGKQYTLFDFGKRKIG